MRIPPEFKILVFCGYVILGAVGMAIARIVSAGASERTLDMAMTIIGICALVFFAILAAVWILLHTRR